ncbi:putative glutathione S-transferase-related transmembrane protein [Sporocytophaga myxococcoides]|uniref:Putative glutathione S-transferase-related transmembrane protein n=2 Tax=Sporocytophaga myxococcoides TaxID=153721 RepID=A0A098LEV2_9BACT|nr:putative glutathione S-transferase-related transmembrane protein [Sporocytophaga myxococcoides]
MNFNVDKANNKIKVEREFDAPLAMVWSAWTESELLDQWWAPHPYIAETKSMDFREGGMWLYCMIGPKGERHWSRADYKTIKPEKQFVLLDAFCDENGVINKDFPRSTWSNIFKQTEETTTVNIEISYDKLEDLEATIKMGFQEGFTAGLENLDHYLSTQFRLRKENKTSNKARVTTYLNFPGKTEEAFNFYQKVFNGRLTGDGLRRFGDIELPAGAPPMSEADKKLIIHAELTILGGHVLMATDAPESMGFKLVEGNNMHINVEPESREETERIFKELSEGGQVTMPLADMFWGAYYGSFKDKFGINWMFNYQKTE